MTVMREHSDIAVLLERDGTLRHPFHVCARPRCDHGVGERQRAALPTRAPAATGLAPRASCPSPCERRRLPAVRIAACRDELGRGGVGSNQNGRATTQASGSFATCRRTAIRSAWHLELMTVKCWRGAGRQICLTHHVELLQLLRSPRAGPYARRGGGADFRGPWEIPRTGPVTGASLRTHGGANRFQHASSGGSHPYGRSDADNSGVPRRCRSPGRRARWRSVF
jgi:hypothetical protein